MSINSFVEIKSLQRAPQGRLAICALAVYSRFLSFFVCLYVRLSTQAAVDEAACVDTVCRRPPA